MAGRDIDLRVEGNSQVNVAAAGDFVFVKSSSAALDYETEAGKLVTMTTGDKLRERGAGFKGFTVFNNSVIPVIAQLTVGYGDFDKAIALGTINLTKSLTGGALADLALSPGTSVNAIPTNTARREAIISNLDTAITVRVNVGSGATATRGIPLLPQQTIVLTTTAQIQIYQPSGPVVTVALLEIND